MPDYNAINAAADKAAARGSAAAQLNPANIFSPVSQADIDSGGRYDKVYFGVDTENIYAENQTTGEKWRNGVVKMLGTAATTLVGSTVGLLNGVYQAIDDGKFSSFYDNDLTRRLDQFNKDLSNSMPHYSSLTERNASALSNVWSANFWSDTILQGVGFTLGSLAAGGAWAKGIGLAVKGIAKGIAGGTIGEVAAATEEAALLATQTATAGRAQSTLMGAANKFLANQKLVDFGKNIVTANLGAMGEASIEAMHARQDYRQRQIDDYISKNGVEPDEQALKLIDSYADTVGNFTFGGNVALLTATNYIQFPKLMQAFRPGRQAVSNAERGLGRIITQGDDVTTRTVAAATPGRAMRILNRFKNYGGLVFSPREAAEEGAQYALPIAIEDFVEKGKAKESRNLLESIGQGIYQTFTDKEGQTSLLAGGLTGGLLELRSNAGRLWSSRGKKERTNQFVSAINAVTAKTYITSGLESFSRSQKIGADLDAALLNNDKLAYEDAKTDLSLNYLIPRIQFGRFDMVKDDIQDTIALANTQEGFLKLQEVGWAPQEMTREEFTQNMGKLLTTAESVNTQYEALSRRYGATRDENGKLKYDNGVLFKMAYAGAKIDDYNARIESLLPILNQVNLPILAQIEKIANNQLTEEDLQNLTNSIDELAQIKTPREIPSETIDEVREAAADILELAARRRQKVAEYKMLRDNPTQFQDPPIDIAGDIEESMLTPEEIILNEAPLPEDAEVELEEGDYDFVKDLAMDIADGVDFTDNAEAQQFQANYPKLLEHYLNLIREERAKGIKSAKEQFAEANAETIFNYNGRQGTLKYDPTTDRLTINGREVSNQDIANGLLTTEEQIQDPQGYLTTEDSRILDISQGRVIENLNDILRTTNDRLEKVQKSIASKKADLQQLQEDMNVEQWKAEELVARKKGWFNQKFVATLSTLSELRQETQQELDTLQEEQTQLEAQQTALQELINAPILTLQDAVDLLEQQQAQIEDLVVQNGTLIQDLQGVVNDTQSLINRLTDVIRTKLESFKAKNPGIAQVDLALRALDSNENPLYYLEGIESARLLSQTIQEIQDLEIEPARVRERKTVGEINDVLKTLNKLDREMQAKQAILDQLIVEQEEVETRKGIAEKPQEEVVDEEEIGGVTPVPPGEGGGGVVDIPIEDELYPDHSERKPITTIFKSTVLPRNRENYQWYNNFLNALNKVRFYTNEKKQNLRMMTVTANTEESLGVKGLIDHIFTTQDGAPYYKTTEEKNDPINGAIAVVMTELDPSTNEYYFLDANGQRIGKVGEANLVTNLVTTMLPTASLTWRNGQTNYAERKDVEPEDVRAAYEQQRSAILTATSPMVTKFQVSKGRPKNKRGERFPIVGNLIPASEVNTPGILNVLHSSTGTITDNLGNVYQASSLGKSTTMIKYDEVFEPAKLRQLNEQEANKLFDLLSFYSRRQNTGRNTEILKYIQGLTYLPLSRKKVDIKEEDEIITVEEGKKVRNKISDIGGGPVIVLNGKTFTFSREYLEKNKEEVIKALQELNTQVNERLLQREVPFQEITGINEEGVLQTKEYTTYQEFVLASETPLISTTVKESTGNTINDMNFIDKYAILANFSSMSQNRREEAPAPEGSTPGPIILEGVLPQGYYTVPTSSSSRPGYLVVDEGTYQRWQEVDNEQKEETLRNQNSSKDAIYKSKEAKRIVMEYAKRKREVLGEDLPTSVSDRDVTKLQVGDSVTIGENNYMVTGHAFGHAMVAVNGAKSVRITNLPNATTVTEELFKNKKVVLRETKNDLKVTTYGYGTSIEKAVENFLAEQDIPLAETLNENPEDLTSEDFKCS